MWEVGVIGILNNQGRTHKESSIRVENWRRWGSKSSGCLQDELCRQRAWKVQRPWGRVRPLHRTLLLPRSGSVSYSWEWTRLRTRQTWVWHSGTSLTVCMALIKFFVSSGLQSLICTINAYQKVWPCYSSRMMDAISCAL